MRAEVFEETTLFAGGIRHRLVKHLVDNVRSELPVGFELRFIEKLIRRGLVREIGMVTGIFEYICRFVSRERGFEVNEEALRGPGVDDIVSNGADAMVPQAMIRSIFSSQAVHVQLDLYS